MGFNSKIKCYTCKQFGCKSDQCPKSKKWCNNCKTRTHNTKDCRKKDHGQQSDGAKYARERPQKQEDRNAFMFQVTDDLSNSKDTKCLMARLSVDCGATTLVINNEKNFVSFENNFDPNIHLSS